MFELVSKDELHQVPSKVEQLCLESGDLEVPNWKGSSNLPPHFHCPGYEIGSVHCGTRYESFYLPLPVKWMSMRIIWYCTASPNKVFCSTIAIGWIHHRHTKKQHLLHRWTHQAWPQGKCERRYKTVWTTMRTTMMRTGEAGRSMAGQWVRYKLAIMLCHFDGRSGR